MITALNLIVKQKIIIMKIEERKKQNNNKKGFVNILNPQRRLKRYYILSLGLLRNAQVFRGKFLSLLLYFYFL